MCPKAMLNSASPGLLAPKLVRGDAQEMEEDPCSIIKF